MITFKSKALAAAGVIATLTLVSTVTAQKPRPAIVLKLAGTANDPMAGSWLSWGRTQGKPVNSPLNLINTSNVDKLGRSWSYVLCSGGGQEGTPLMWNNTLFGETTWSVVYAVDARTGKQLWRWAP